MKTAVILHALFSEFTYEQLEAIFSLAKEHNGKFRIVPTGIQIYDITKAWLHPSVPRHATMEFTDLCCTCTTPSGKCSKMDAFCSFVIS